MSQIQIHDQWLVEYCKCKEWIKIFHLVGSKSFGAIDITIIVMIFYRWSIIVEQWLISIVLMRPIMPLEPCDITSFSTAYPLRRWREGFWHRNASHPSAYIRIWYWRLNGMSHQDYSSPHDLLGSLDIIMGDLLKIPSMSQKWEQLWISGSYSGGPSLFMHFMVGHSFEHMARHIFHQQ